jgi:peptidyl-prolyl cis-trans isomerase B (cyclophilin B)
MTRRTVLVSLAVATLALAAAHRAPAQDGKASDTKKGTSVKQSAVITMEKGGEIKIDFYPADAPKTVENFVTLAKKGFYDGLAFHRVVRNFMIQGGCPNTRAGAVGVPGTGRPDAPPLRAEFNDVPHTRGILSMARSRDPNSAGSQFFVVHAAHAPHLDGQYTVFGKVEEGLDVLDAIASADCSFSENGERSTPKERIEIHRVALRARQPRPEAAPPADAQQQEAAG